MLDGKGSLRRAKQRRALARRARFRPDNSATPGAGRNITRSCVDDRNLKDQELSRQNGLRGLNSRSHSTHLTFLGTASGCGSLSRVIQLSGESPAARDLTFS
jgi:hypothetical protein